MKRVPEILELAGDPQIAIEEQPQVQHYLTPLYLATIGFFIYYGLFASVGRTKYYDQNNPLQTLAGVWKLAIFTITMWRVSGAATLNRKRSVLVGTGVAVCGASLLLVVESLYPAWRTLTVRLLVEGVEACGEALICAGLVAYIRAGTAGDDWRYFRQTTALRIGQNSGMVFALIANGCWDAFPQGYPMVLWAMRVLVAMLLIRLVKSVVIRDHPRREIKPEKPSVTRKRFCLDVIAGACAYALFFLVIFGPSSVAAPDTYALKLPLGLNGGFAAASMITIYLLSENARRWIPDQDALLKFESMAALGAIVVIAIWMVSLWPFARLSENAGFWKWSLIGSGGVLGLFTTITYVFGELSSGLHGKPEHRAGQIVSYLGWARLGPFAALVMISITKLLSERMPWWVTIAILESTVLIGSVGVALGVAQKQKWKIKPQGENHE